MPRRRARRRRADAALREPQRVPAQVARRLSPRETPVAPRGIGRSPSAPLRPVRSRRARGRASPETPAAARRAGTRSRSGRGGRARAPASRRRAHGARSVRAEVRARSCVRRPRDGPGPPRSTPGAGGAPLARGSREHRTPSREPESRRPGCSRWQRPRSAVARSPRPASAPRAPPRRSRRPARLPAS